MAAWGQMPACIPGLWTRMRSTSSAWRPSGAARSRLAVSQGGLACLQALLLCGRCSSPEVHDSSTPERREYRATHPEEAKEARDALISVYLTLVRSLRFQPLSKSFDAVHAPQSCLLTRAPSAVLHSGGPVGAGVLEEEGAPELRAGEVLLLTPWAARCAGHPLHPAYQDACRRPLNMASRPSMAACLARQRVLGALGWTRLLCTALPGSTLAAWVHWGIRLRLGWLLSAQRGKHWLTPRSTNLESGAGAEPVMPPQSTLVGLWLVPAIVSVRFGFWRFVLVRPAQHTSGVDAAATLPCPMLGSGCAVTQPV